MKYVFEWLGDVENSSTVRSNILLQPLPQSGHSGGKTGFQADSSTERQARQRLMKHRHFDFASAAYFGELLHPLCGLP